MKRKIWLSKSTYLRSLQCKKSLFLYKNYYHLRDQPSAKKLQLFQQGHNIEAQVRQLFYPNGINVAPPHPRSWNKSVTATQLLIHNQQPIIYEGAFNYNGTMCAVDITTIQNNQLTLFEIKRGSIIKDIYLKDVALQYYVIASLGYTIQDFFLINYLGEDKEILSNNKDDYQFTSVLDHCQQQQTIVDNNIRQAERVLQHTAIPEQKMGSHCCEPYQCDFYSFCERSSSIIGE